MDERQCRRSLREQGERMSAHSEKISFPGARGTALAANLEAPTGTPKAYALFAHCFTCSKDNFAAARISKGLAERGIAVLRFDFTGLGHSEGDFANSDFSSNVGDLVAAADWLRANRAAPRLLIGHSLGGAAVLVAASRVPEAAAVATIGAPADPADVRHLLGESAVEIERTGEAAVSIGGRRFRIRRAFLEDIAAQPMQAAIGGLRRALLVFHAPGDAVVGIANASAIFRAAKHPKSFVSLHEANHLLTRKADAAYVADVLAAWAGRYIVADSGPGRVDAAAEADTVTVSENGVGRFGQDITAGPHLFNADEPLSVGGRNSGPTPYQLLSAALGACTSMTIRLYADQKQWPLDRCAVTVRHSKIHAEDCAECETKEGRIDRFEREIALSGPLDDEQRRRILAIAEKCPVHRTLHSEIQIVTRARD
jgi:putative redox protein